MIIVMDEKVMWLECAIVFESCLKVHCRIICLFDPIPQCSLSVAMFGIAFRAICVIRRKLDSFKYAIRILFADAFVVDALCYWMQHCPVTLLSNIFANNGRLT